MRVLRHGRRIPRILVASNRDARASPEHVRQAQPTARRDALARKPALPLVKGMVVFGCRVEGSGNRADLWL